MCIEKQNQSEVLLLQYLVSQMVPSYRQCHQSITSCLLVWQVVSSASVYKGSARPQLTCFTAPPGSRYPTFPQQSRAGLLTQVIGYFSEGPSVLNPYKQMAVTARDTGWRLLLVARPNGSVQAALSLSGSRGATV